MKPPLPSPKTRRWLAGAALLAIAPKCVLCVLAYAGIAFGKTAFELCGASDNASRIEPIVWSALAVALFVIAGGVHRRSRLGKLRNQSGGDPGS